MSALLMLLLSVLPPASPVDARLSISTPAMIPLSSSEASRSTRFGPATASAFPPETQGPISSHSVQEHHRKTPHVISPSPTSSSEVQGCDEISCSDPLTPTPIGSPCGCVYPMQVKINLAVAPYQLFPRIEELEVEVAAGTFLKQSQVRIMGADVIPEDLAKTTVTIDLVPLGEKFDKMTALLTYERFWQKRVLINASLFGDYDVLYIHYPGLPSSPPKTPGGSLGSGGIGSNEYPITANVHARSMQKMNAKHITVIALSLTLFVLMCIGICLVSKYKCIGRSPTCAGPKISPSITRKTGIRSLLSSVASSTSASHVSTMATFSPSVKAFSIAEIEKATDNFNFNRILGEGGFARVYHGTIQGGIEVAIKLLTRKDQNGDREFIAEVEILSRLHHRNLVKLVGICVEKCVRCLVYELVPNGSVESYLHGSDRIKGPLDWDTRMKIALGAARGLAYLHEDANPCIIHRDFKASNVLLEDDFTPKVSDFGLAREASDAVHHISTQVMGTFGYVAPEYAMTGHLLVKSDVYSYGVMLLELLSGRKPIDMSQPQGAENLVTWARPLLANGEGLKQLIDPALQGNYDFDKVAKLAAVASMCVHIDVSQRPFMGEVVQALKLVYNDLDEACNISFSQSEDSFRMYCDLKVECPSSFMTMEYSSGPMEGMQRPRSASELEEKMEFFARYSGSGPLKTERHKQSF